jgi:hypothetical protein
MLTPASCLSTSLPLSRIHSFVSHGLLSCPANSSSPSLRAAVVYAPDRCPPHPVCRCRWSVLCACVRSLSVSHCVCLLCFASSLVPLNRRLNNAVTIPPSQTSLILLASVRVCTDGSHLRPIHSARSGCHWPRTTDEQLDTDGPLCHSLCSVLCVCILLPPLCVVP